MNDAVTEVAAWQALQEVIRVIAEAQLPREELGDNLVLPDLLIDMSKVALNGMKSLSIIEPHPAAPGTHTTLATWHALFQDYAETLIDAFVTYTRGLPFIFHASENRHVPNGPANVH